MIFLNPMKWPENELYEYDDDAFVRATDQQTSLELSREEGEKRGRQEAQCVIARRLLASNFSVLEIAQITGLSAEEVNALKK